MGSQILNHITSKAKGFIEITKPNLHTHTHTKRNKWAHTQRGKSEKVTLSCLPNHFNKKEKTNNNTL